jgi:hypothetical protein
MPYYRGTFLSLVHAFTLRVDGADVPREQIRFLVAGKTFSMAEVEEADEVRWEFGAPAVVRVARTGGLAPGLHEIEVGIVIRKSYLPPEDPERLYDFYDVWKTGKYTTFIEPPTVVKKKITLVQ